LPRPLDAKKNFENTLFIFWLNIKNTFYNFRDAGLFSKLTSLEFFFHFTIPDQIPFSPKRHLLEIQIHQNFFYKRNSFSCELWQYLFFHFTIPEAFHFLPNRHRLKIKKTHFLNFFIPVAFQYSPFVYNRTSFIPVRGNYFLLEGAPCALKKFLPRSFFSFLFCSTFCFSH
jgi:hypothetical protein